MDSFPCVGNCGTFLLLTFTVIISGLFGVEKTTDPINMSIAECTSELKITGRALLEHKQTENRTAFTVQCSRYQQLITDCNFTKELKQQLQQPYTMSCKSDRVLNWLSKPNCASMVTFPAHIVFITFVIHFLRIATHGR